MEDIQALEKVGLTKNDRKIYLVLLESGSSTASGLVKKTGLHRSYIYDILDKLIDIGLASFIIKNNKKYFSIEHLDRILQILQTEEEKIKKSQKEIEKIIPELIKRKETVTEKQTARLFLGKEGIKSVLEDILKTRKDFVAFGAEGKFKDIFTYYFNNWQRRRSKLGIRYKLIYGKLKGSAPTTGQKLIEVRFLPEKYEFPATTLVYGNKVAIVVWETSPIAFVLESEKAVKSFLSYFDLLWSIGKK